MMMYDHDDDWRRWKEEKKECDAQCHWKRPKLWLYIVDYFVKENTTWIHHVTGLLVLILSQTLNKLTLALESWEHFSSASCDARDHYQWSPSQWNLFLFCLSVWKANFKTVKHIVILARAIFAIFTFHCTLTVYRTMTCWHVHLDSGHSLVPILILLITP